MKDFTPLSKRRRSQIMMLAQTKHRRSERLFTVEGHKNVLDLLSKHCFKPVWIIARDRVLHEEGEELCRLSGISDDNIFSASEADMKSISTFSTPSEIMCVFKIPYEIDAEDFLLLDPSGLYLMLDGVQDPGNLGTIIRTAHWFGVKKIIASRNTVDLYNPKTIQSTMGSLGSVEVIYADLQDIIMKNPFIPVCGLQLEGENLFSAKLPATAFICMGSEGRGLSDGVRELLTDSYTIPASDPTDHPESLNVAIATAITLSQFRK